MGGVEEADFEDRFVDAKLLEMVGGGADEEGFIAAEKTALPNRISVVEVEIMKDAAAGYEMIPSSKYSLIDCRIARAGLPFLTGTADAPQSTSYHFLYLGLEYPIGPSDYLFLEHFDGAVQTTIPFLVLGEYNYGRDRGLRSYLIKRTNTQFIILS